MRKIIIILLVLLIGVLAVALERNIYPSGKDELNFSYFDSNNEYIYGDNFIYTDYNDMLGLFKIYFKFCNTIAIITLTPRTKQNLLEAIEKYHKWNTIAHENEKMISKEISEDVILFCWFNKFSEYLSDYKLDLNKVNFDKELDWNRDSKLYVVYYFHSQSITRHKFVIGFDVSDDVVTFEDGKNREDAFNLYFDYQGVKLLEYKLSNKCIAKRRKEYEEIQMQTDDEGLFE